MLIITRGASFVYSILSPLEQLLLSTDGFNDFVTTWLSTMELNRIYKWEDSPGLGRLVPYSTPLSQEHACRNCGTKQNQQQIVLDVSQEEVDMVTKGIHGAKYNIDKFGGHPDVEDVEPTSILNTNEAYNSAMKNHMSWLKGQVSESRARTGKQRLEAQRMQKSKDAENGLRVKKRDVEEANITILSELDVLVPDKAPSTNKSARSRSRIPSRRRKRKPNFLIQQLWKEIAADIEKSENEVPARRQRVERYWRFVNRTVPDRLASSDELVHQAADMMLKRDDGR
jgi:hypothetical protein